MDANGNLRPPSRQLLATWIVAAWKRISPQLIVKAFVSTGITTPADYQDTAFAELLEQHPDQFVGAEVHDILVGERDGELIRDAIECSLADSDSEQEDMDYDDDSSKLSDAVGQLEDQDDCYSDHDDDRNSSRTYDEIVEELRKHNAHIVDVPRAKFSTQGGLVGEEIIFRWSTGWYVGRVVKECSATDKRKGFNYLIEYPPREELHLQLLKCGDKYQFERTSPDGSWMVVEVV